MSYDPTIPANGSPMASAELRNQFNALKELIDAKPSHDQMLININQAVNDGSSANSNDVGPLNLTVSDPPTQAEIQGIADKMDELIVALRR